MWNEKIEASILYEDREIIVCHKPAGIAVQNARIGAMDMESALKNYLTLNRERNNQEKKGGSHHSEQPAYLGVVHRLDQPVEGVIVFAKTPGAAKELSRQITVGEMGKYYLAVTDQKPVNKEGVLEDYLKKDGKTNTSAVVQKGTPGAKKARLFYQVLEEKEGCCLLRIQLETGRHHQIRVQMAHAGMPLLGDYKYRKNVTKKDIGTITAAAFKDADIRTAASSKSITSLGLCAANLTFRHPSTKKNMDFKVTPAGNAFELFA